MDPTDDPAPLGGDDRLARHVHRLVEAAQAHRDDQEDGRRAAMDYYAGKMTDLPAGAGQSSVVSMDVRAVYKKVMPSILRAVLGGDTVVTYDPVGPEDEATAAQATDYVNHVVLAESGAPKAIHDAIHDACLVKTGILKWRAYERREAVVHAYTDQPAEALIGLEGLDGVEVIDLSARPETDPDVLALDPAAQRLDFRLRRVQTRRDVRLEAVPRSLFLISPDADSIEEAELVGEEMTPTRSQLVSWGYDRERVAMLATHEEAEVGARERKGVDFGEASATAKALQKVLVFDVYVRLDADGDGIGELHRVLYGEGVEPEGLIVLDHEEVDEAPYGEVVIERDPHQFEGHSLYEDTRDVQRVKTALLRGALDNLYRVNAPRPAVDVGALTHPEDVADWVAGKPIRLKSGSSVQQALQWSTVPSIVGAVFPVIEYMDQVARDRTGVTDASGGVDPEGFQNMSATAAALMSESGIAQADAIVRSVARCLRRPFAGLLRLVIAHADAPRTLRLKGKWQTYDPRLWNSGMDCTVNTGLGGGTKERDLAVLQVILGLQREVMASFGPDNPIVSPGQIYNSLAKIAETAGFAGTERYFSEPSPEDVKARVEAAKSAPSPEQQRLQAQMQIEQAKMQAQVAKEQAQMEADLAVKRAEIEAEDRRFMQELALRREQMAQEERLALARMASDRVAAQARAAQPLVGFRPDA